MQFVNLIRGLKELNRLAGSALPIALLIIAQTVSSTAWAAGDNEQFIPRARAFTFTETAPANGDDRFDMSFAMGGRDVTLKLHRNRKLTRGFDVQAASPGIALYAGRIAGVDNSWARITRHEGGVTGAVYDGQELYIIDRLGTVQNNMPEQAARALRSRGARSVVFPLSRVVDTSVCGVADNTPNASHYDAMIADMQAAVAQAATSEVNVAIVADTEYVATSDGDTEGQVLSQMNVVDGIFSEQVGVQFGLDQILPLTDNGPLTATSASNLLYDFRSFTVNETGNPGLAHLFSGKNLDGNVIGIAFLRTLCSSYVVAVTQAGGRGMLGALTAAHEFGHNFGAPHDNQSGSACASTPGSFLMNPSLNGSDEFSQCSLDQIAPVVDAASCLEPVDDPPPSPVDCDPDAVDFTNTTPFTSVNSGSANVVEGCRIELSGNIWRATEQTFNITPDTVIEFTFSGNSQGEIHGIGFDGDSSASGNRIFQLDGSQNWGIRDFDYTADGDAQTFTIPVGQYYTGTNMRLVVVNDKDSGTENNTGTFTNVVVNSPEPPPVACDEAAVPLDNLEPFSAVNSGSVNTVDGCRLEMFGNVWRATQQTFDVTPDTVIEFTYSGNSQGEIHGIGFDGDDTASGNRIFQLDGSQDWGIREYDYIGGGEPQTFAIPVGQFYTGDNMRLILVNDKDNGSENNTGAFTNVIVTPGANAE
jgi:hypothetical protein